MKKIEIIQLVLIVLGISVIINALVTLFEQLTIYSKVYGEPSFEFSLITIQAAILIIIFIIGYILIFRSDFLAKKISKDENSTPVSISIRKDDVIHVSIMILCLFFMIKLLPSFLSTLYMVIMAFVNDFSMFKDLFPQQLWVPILYISIIIILINSNRFASWLQRKMLN
jgi:hypothetical protein